LESLCPRGGTDVFVSKLTQPGLLLAAQSPDGFLAPDEGDDPMIGGPTGITLDPAKPRHLWIVDSWTDRVYQYDYMVDKHYYHPNPGIHGGGVWPASASYALAASNTNPQGIADPPPAALAEPLPAPAAPVPPSSVSGDTATAPGDPAVGPAPTGVAPRTIPAAWLAPDSVRPDRPADPPAERAQPAAPTAGAIEPSVRRVIETARLAAGFLPPDEDDPASGWWAIPLDPAS
jgi:hypothetical protein